MPTNLPITGLSTFTAYSGSDLIEVVDVSDTTMDPTGTNKQVTFSSLISLAGLLTTSSTIPLAKLATQAANTIVANATGSTAAPTAAALHPNLEFTAGGVLRASKPIWVCTGPGTAVANSTTLTSLFTGTTAVGSLTIPANTLLVGSRLKFDIFGTIGIAAATTIYCEISLGGVLIGKGTTTSIATTGSGLAWLLDLAVGPGFFVRSLGATGTIRGMQRFNAVTLGSISLNVSGTSSAAATAATIDTTGNLVIDVKIQWGTANAGNTIQLTDGSIYLY